MLRAGIASRHAPARWLRVLDFDFFFLGTAMMTPGLGTLPDRQVEKVL